MTDLRDTAERLPAAIRCKHCSSLILQTPLGWMHANGDAQCALYAAPADKARSKEEK